jgi:S-adenosylmethionine synthetase
LDVKGRGIGGLYLTVLGSSVDTGDSGQVGRGNNAVGVIPLNRPMSSEAAAGKNPVSHVGKIYNLLSYRIANRVCENVNGIKETYIWLVSSIGKPINEPSVCSAQVIPEDGVKFEELVPQIEEVIYHEFDHLDEFCNDLALGKINIC